ncbi:hypothetical protein AWN76_002670 [Rhodothermaceae bacterium RA]|nr:hypothetical protein AWN76_002670 [Rhodothermaceae bacterium RA]
MNRENMTYETEWPAVLDGDRTAFHRLIEPHLDELLRAARRDLAYHRQLGDLPPDFVTPEELVGETLLRAWKSRRQRPAGLSLRAWLLGTQHRVLQKLIRAERLERGLWAVSLEDPLPPEPLFDDDESFWEWYQPDDLPRWEDAIPDEDAPLPDEALEDESALGGLEPEPRQVLLLHDRHALTLAEVAVATGRSVRETARLLQEARRKVRRVRAAS